MNTTTTANAVEIELLQQQLRLTDQVVRLNVDGISQEESLIQPAPAGNCLNWVVGHLLCVYHNALQLMGKQSVMSKDALKRYDRGSAPMIDPAEALQLRDLMSAWKETVQRFNDGLASLTPATLDVHAPFSPSNNPNETVRSLLGVVAFHQAYHAGQLGILRRIAGKEGAIA